MQLQQPTALLLFTAVLSIYRASVSANVTEKNHFIPSASLSVVLSVGRSVSAFGILAKQLHGSGCRWMVGGVGLSIGVLDFVGDRRRNGQFWG